MRQQDVLTPVLAEMIWRSSVPPKGTWQDDEACPPTKPSLAPEMPHWSASPPGPDSSPAGLRGEGWCFPPHLADSATVVMGTAGQCSQVPLAVRLGQSL